MLFVGAGSAKAPKDALAIMTKIGEKVREAEGWIRTGHTKGPDTAFEAGARERSIVYLPRAGFNPDVPFYTKFIRDLGSVSKESYKVAMHSVYKYHPAYRGLGDISKRMLATSYFKVLGEGGDRPADAIVCWTDKLKGGRPSGMAAQTIRIAEDHGIPIINMSDSYYSGLGFEGIWSALLRSCGESEWSATKAGKILKESTSISVCAAVKQRATV